MSKITILFSILFSLILNQTAQAASTEHCTIITDLKTNAIIHKSGEICHLLDHKNPQFNIDMPKPQTDNLPNKYINKFELDNGWAVYGTSHASIQKGTKLKKQAWFAGWLAKDNRILSFTTIVVEGQPAKGSATQRLRKSFFFNLSNLSGL